MNKKGFILLFLMFMLCGCSAEVNVHIGNRITEEVNITYYQDEYNTKESIAKSFKDFIPVYYDTILFDADPDVKKNGVDYYSKKVTDLGNGYKFTYSYSFPYKKYVQARTVKGGFASPFVGTHSTTNNMVLSTGNNGCFYIDNYPGLTEVVVNITTDYEVVSTNGTKNGNTYSWVFTKGDNRKNIYIEYKKSSNSEPVIIDKDVEVKNSNEKEMSAFQKFANEHPFLLAGIAFLIVLIVVLVISKVQSNKYR